MDMQVQILEELITLTEATSIPIWFYGGYALDALEGKSTRPHGDIDFFARKKDSQGEVQRLLELTEETMKLLSESNS